MYPTNSARITRQMDLYLHLLLPKKRQLMRRLKEQRPGKELKMSEQKDTVLLNAQVF